VLLLFARPVMAQSFRDRDIDACSAQEVQAAFLHLMISDFFDASVERRTANLIGSTEGAAWAEYFSTVREWNDEWRDDVRPDMPDCAFSRTVSAQITEYLDYIHFASLYGVTSLYLRERGNEDLADQFITEAASYDRKATDIALEMVELMESVQMD
jgi:hypothetical protein